MSYTYLIKFLFFRKRKKSLKKKAPTGYDDDLRFGARPEPLGRSNTPDLDEPYKRGPQSRLPPLQPAGETKKKRKKKKRQVEDEEQYYRYDD